MSNYVYLAGTDHPDQCFNRAVLRLLPVAGRGGFQERCQRLFPLFCAAAGVLDFSDNVVCGGGAGSRADREGS